MKHYWVIGPQVTRGGWYGEPPESGRDVVCVRAENRNKARWVALKTPEFKEHRGEVWPGHPLTDLEVQDAVCAHGICFCDLKDCENTQAEYCAQCCAEEGHKIIDGFPCWCGEKTGEHGDAADGGNR